MIIVGWALERKGYPMNVGPEIEKLHREQFGGAHQLFYFIDSLEKESFFYVNRNNHLRQKKGFFVYYRLEERFDEPDRIKIEIPNELEPRREKAREYTRKGEVGTRKGEYRQYMVSQQTKQENCDGAGFVVVFVAAIVIALGIGAYTGMDMLRKHSDRTVEVISTEGIVERQEKTKDSTMMMTTMISSISRADRVSRSKVVRIFSVDTLASSTPWEAPDSVGWGSPEWSPLSRDRVSVMGMAIRI